MYRQETIETLVKGDSVRAETNKISQLKNGLQRLQLSRIQTDRETFANVDITNREWTICPSVEHIPLPRPNSKFTHLQKSTL